MKMEIVLRADRDAMVKAVYIKPGDRVAAKDLLIGQGKGTHSIPRQRTIPCPARLQRDKGCRHPIMAITEEALVYCAGASVTRPASVRA